MCLFLGIPAACLGWVPLDQPDTSWPSWASQMALHPNQPWYQSPWNWWSAAWLHGSAQHLQRNLMALSLIAALGYTARVPERTAWAWFFAWPITQLGMLGQPLHVYIGLSGVLHAGAALIALHQVTKSTTPSGQILGYALLGALIFKILMENPWQHTLIRPPGSDINVAPWAHVSGALSALLTHLFASVTNRPPSVK